VKRSEEKWSLIKFGMVNSFIASSNSSDFFSWPFEVFLEVGFHQHVLMCFIQMALPEQ
jgi:hypothetical protein